MEIIPVIHIISGAQLLANIDTCLYCGLKKAFLIDHVGNEKNLFYFADVIKRKYPDFWIGINLLGHDSVDLIINPEHSESLSKVDAIWSDDDLSFMSKEELIDIKSKRLFKGQLFGGLAFKYQKQPSNLELACENSKIITDVSTTSGSGTGSAPTSSKIKTLKSHLGTHPLAIASGINESNCFYFSDYADYGLVASSITNSRDELIYPFKLSKLIELSKIEK